MNEEFIKSLISGAITSKLGEAGKLLGSGLIGMVVDGVYAAIKDAINVNYLPPEVVKADEVIFTEEVAKK